MSHSDRDSDVRKLRQLARAKSALIPQPCSAEEVERIKRSPAYLALQADFDRLFEKYGFNPDIFNDNERSGSKRAVTRKIKDAVKRSSKRSDKQRVRRDLQSPDGKASDA